jgi:predicted nucleotide-binding protein (sugar kinase/HSP70/actin superfamily)
MVNSPNFGNDKKSTNCPIIQGSSYLFKNSLEERIKCNLLNPIIKIGKGNLHSTEFINSCKIIANLFGVSNRKWKIAFENAIEVQNNYHSNCYELGDSALEYCRANNIKPVVILGKLYSIYNSQLNSNIPNYLRELGILPIPMDCYRINESTPIFQNIYWGYSQNVLRAVYQISESQNIYSILCTNYSCGPDSFLENFYNYIMKGKVSLIIENDGEAGNSGIKMRLEIFQHCIKEKRKNDSGSSHINIDEIFKDLNIRLNDVFKSTNKLLLPCIGYSSSIVAACLRGSSINAEALPVPDKETLDFGRMYTSGKECFPMSVTLGSLLQYIHRSEFPKGNNKIFYFLPGSEGPCRFGNYNLLDKIIIENLGLQKRVIVLSPANQEFFNEMPSSLNALIYLSLILIDHLVACANYIRPVETLPGETKKLFEYYHSKLIQQLEDIDCYKISNNKLIWEIVSGNLFGFTKFLHCVAKDFSSIYSKRKIQTVAIDGALYVRLDPFSNQNIVGKIESNCLRVEQVPFTEWLDFLNIVDQPTDNKWDFGSLLNKLLKSRIRYISNRILYKEAGIPKFLNLKRQIKEISSYIGFEAIGEAILSIGGSIINSRKGKVDAILNIGPNECLQCKIAESILAQNYKKNNLITKSIEFNGDPIDPKLIEDFVYDVKKK